jgi:hypothetical protein
VEAPADRPDSVNEPVGGRCCHVDRLSESVEVYRNEDSWSHVGSRVIMGVLVLDNRQSFRESTNLLLVFEEATFGSSSRAPRPDVAVEGNRASCFRAPLSLPLLTTDVPVRKQNLSTGAVVSTIGHDICAG